MIAARVDGMDRQQMRELADSLRNKLKSAVMVLASAEIRRSRLYPRSPRI